jgi:hypothetical protein
VKERNLNDPLQLKIIELGNTKYAVNHVFASGLSASLQVVSGTYGAIIQVPFLPNDENQRSPSSTDFGPNPMYPRLLVKKDLFHEMAMALIGAFLVVVHGVQLNPVGFKSCRVSVVFRYGDRRPLLQ